MSADQFLDRLRNVLGPDGVATDAATIEALGHDHRRRRRAYHEPPAVPPVAVVLPRSTAQVAETLRIAGMARVPVVPLGGGTGLMGAGRPVVPGIVLDLRLMDAVLAVSPEDRTATVQGGIVIADLNRALAPHGLFCGHDPWTVPMATVGGALSTNGLGYLGGKYGAIAEQALGIEVVLASGQVIQTRAVARSSAGPRVDRLFAGAEGQLGVITAATLRVFPVPERRLILGFDAPSFAAGFRAALAMFRAGLTPALLDFGAPPDDGGRLYVGFEGAAGPVEAEAAIARRLCEAEGARPVPEQATRTFWEQRHVRPEQLRAWRRADAGTPQPGSAGSAITDYIHIGLPASRVPEYIARATPLLTEGGGAIHEWGLWHGPELLSMVVSRPTPTPEALDAAAAATTAALMLAQDLGGTMEYVHGPGLRYAHLMAREHGAAFDVLRAVKGVLDPEGVLNPGKGLSARP